MAKRNSKVLGVWGRHGTRVVASEAQWRMPLKWNRAAQIAEDVYYERQANIPSDEPPPDRPRVFCASLADVFEAWEGPMSDSIGKHLVHSPKGWHPEDRQELESASRVTMNDVRLRLFGLIDATPNLDYLLLTKRPQNIAAMMPKRIVHDKRPIFPGCPGPLGEPIPCIVEGGIRHNVWIGATVEDQQRADERIPHLLGVPAAVRFLSVEPLLEPVDLSLKALPIDCPECDGSGTLDECHPAHGRRTGEGADMDNCLECNGDFNGVVRGIDWVIIGCESRGKKVGRLPGGTESGYWDAARSLIEQCKSTGVACFHKQAPVNGKVSHDPNEWPEWARVRQFPKGGM